MLRLPSGRERGVALLIVITILVTMVIVAVPFALSMRQGAERTKAVTARSRAEFEAGLLTEVVKLFLLKTTPDQEQQRFLRGDRTVDAQPGVDSLDEITPDDSFRLKLEEEILSEWEKDPRLASKAQYLKSRGLGPLNDDRGSIWTVTIQDAQALVNVNGASPFLLANLLGSALLSDDLDTGGGDIAVEHVVTGRHGGLGGFPRNGGFVRIGREVIAYESFDGTTFRGCERGVLTDTPLQDNGSAGAHKKGDPVIDYTAYKLATHLIAYKPGHLSSFQNLEALRDIASWGENGVLTAARLERVLPFLTVWSQRETSSGFLAEQLVVNALPMSVDGNGPDEIRLRDLQNNPTGTTAYFNPGTIVRITDGFNTVYQTISSTGDLQGELRDELVTTAGRSNAAQTDVTFQGGQTRIAALAPYPININTASREVLYAVMANVQPWNADDKDKIVTPDLAWKLAEDIVLARKGPIRADADTGMREAGPFRHAEDFARFLDAKVRSSEITRGHMQALYLNAINPHSYLLRFGTAPWCFRTLDVYHVESRVALNNRAGEQVAEAGVREVVEIGSDSTASWVLDSQEEFEARLAMGSGAKWATTYPFGVAFKSKTTHHIQPALRGPKGYLNNVYPSAERGEDLGDVRLEPARLLLEDVEVVEHFDTSWYADGHFSGYEGAYKRKTAGTFTGRGDTYVRPFSMSFWWRPYSDSDWTAFDAGMATLQNRFALFVQQGQQGQELTFRCCAGTLARQGAEVYVPLSQLDYQPGNWYHIHVSCDGEDPASMQLLVDGVDIGKRRGVTYLSASLDTEGTDVSVESTDGFPIRGALRIGSEIIEYDSRSSGAFRDCIRGARGTAKLDADGQPTGGYEWPTGTPVHVLGYTMPITLDVMRGGSSLEESMRKWSCVRVTTLNSGPAPDSQSVDLGNGVSFEFGGFAPSRESFTVQVVGMWGQSDDQGYDAFNSRGIAILGSPGVLINGSEPAGEPPLGGWELVYYERQGNQFTISERNIETAWQGEREDYFLITEFRTGNVEFPCFLIPISVLGTAGRGEGEDYLNPGNKLHVDKFSRYYSTSHTDTSGRIAIGTETPQDATEVIRYDSIDYKRGSPGMFFVRDRNINAIAGHFFGNQQSFSSSVPGPDDPTDDDPPPVPPDDPAPPVPPLPGDDPTSPPTGPQDPTPGDGVPPGQRDPGDPTPGTGEPGDPPTPDPGDTPNPGPVDPGGEPPSEPGVGDGPGSGTPDDTSPAPGDGGLEEGGSDPGTGPTPPPDDTTGSEPTPSAGGSVDAGAREGGEDTGDGGGSAPPPEEPTPDDSGGGGDQGTTDEGGDSTVPDVPPPGGRDPADAPDDDETGDTDPTGGVWEPTGPRSAKDLLPFRGVNGTDDHDHTSGSSSSENSRILPCFRVFEEFTGGPFQAGRNDVITITNGVEGAPIRVEAGVRWGDESSDWMCLTDFVDEVFEAPQDGANTRRNDPRGRPRILKFPCSELPDEMGTELEFGQSTLAGSNLVTSFLDELHVWRHSTDTHLAVLDAAGIGEEKDEIRLSSLRTAQRINTIDGLDQECGLFQLEGELIVYRGFRQEGDGVIVLERCARGQMGTRATFHGYQARGRFIPDVPVSYLEGGMTADSSTVPLGRTKGWPVEGLVRIVRDDGAELVHYTRRAESELLMPASLDADERTRDRGLFRGRFGTEALDHDSDAVVVWQPFRYWDRFARRRTQDKDSFSGVHDHPDASYLELGRKARGAYWRGFTWEENLLGRLTGGTETRTDRETLMDIFVMARFSPNVPWDSTHIVDLREEDSFGNKPDLASKARDHLFLFGSGGDKPMGQGKLGNLLELESDTAEFRLYFVYKPNAFRAVDTARSSGGFQQDPVLASAWKLTPWLKSFTANYFARTISRYRAKVR